MKVAFFVALGLLAFGNPVWAINKCTDAKGRTVYQDTACSVESSQQVVNTSGAAAAAGASAANPKRSDPAAADRKDAADKPSEPRRVVLGSTAP